ncbi:MAG: hypothetical protein M5U16_05010 [Hyphomicrobium sp.]|nr:hypothetical protein [Hyphomicrobium sp.]
MQKCVIPLAAIILAGIAAQCASAAERKEYSLSTPYEQLTPAEIAAAKQAAKRRKVSRLSVCADPGNMPLSDNQRQGFQNKIIEAVAQQMGAEVSYFWRPYLERGLTRETFANNECDILLDMPADSASVLTTIPIYRSTYVLAYLSDRHYDFKSLDDPRLKKLRIGTYQHSAIRMVLARYGIKNLRFHRHRHLGRRPATGESALAPGRAAARHAARRRRPLGSVCRLGQESEGRAHHPAAGQPDGGRGAARVQSRDRRAEHGCRAQVHARQRPDGEEGRNRAHPRRLRRAARPVQRLRGDGGHSLARLLRQGGGQEIRGALPQIRDPATGHRSCLG